MSTAMLERIEEAAVVEAEIEEDDDFNHTLCHCNLDKSWCGVSILVSIGEVADLGDKDCPTCSALALQYSQTCPSGCTCTSEMRYYNCVDGEEDENE